MNKMNSLISICIPTYQRPDLIRQAIHSCLQQTYAPIEIVICDDSPDDLTEQVIQSFNQPEKIRYYRNQPALKQADNVNRLFDLALGDRLVLLHDDDLLLPNAVAALACCWELHPDLTAAFGKQQLIDVAGNLLTTSEAFNESYYRTQQYIGYAASSLWSALVAQFPNDGYMVTTEAARQVRCRDYSKVGDVCDYDFGLRLAAQYQGFFFLNDYTAQYRLTKTSISNGNNVKSMTYQVIQSLSLPEALEPVRQSCLQQCASPAINRHIELGNRQAAREIFISKSYSWANRFSAVGLLQAFLLACPQSWSPDLLRWLKKLQQVRLTTVS